MDTTEKKNELHRQQELGKFRDMYVALVDTLVDIYGNIAELNEWKASVHELGLVEIGVIAEEWAQQVVPHQALITCRDPSLFLQNLPCLVKIYVPQLWVQDKFTDNSKRYLWSYLQCLVDSSTGAPLVSGSAKAKEAKDIRPPVQQPGSLPGIGDLYKQMPASMIDKVKGVADKYSHQVESGQTKLEDLKFNEISQELFQNINSDEMQQVVQSVGGLLQTMMGSGGDVGDIGKALFGAK